ncbi:hypothetical protein ABT272_13435 [Streptomyces sp900105245]|uniref:Uncharacterized protein n=1 Tax=Streptomyces sp. 900105245 TaxID=3154379 RepID=A0ABV1U648_9ACTN
MSVGGRAGAWKKSFGLFGGPHHSARPAFEGEVVQAEAGSGAQPRRG